MNRPVATVEKWNSYVRNGDLATFSQRLKTLKMGPSLTSGNSRK